MIKRQTTDLIQRVLRADIACMHAYTVQNSAGLIKLDAMENPHHLPEALQLALGERLGRVALNRYPGSRIEDLRAALASHAGLPGDCALMLGNGSDELISLLALACAKPGAHILAPAPGFVLYEMATLHQGLSFVSVPLTADFELDEAAMLSAIAQHQPALIYLAYPNNPTANLWDDAVIDRIIDAAPGLVVMDEAYQPFASRDSMHRLQKHAHVLVMRTMSKLGLAGVRIGYLMGQSALIEQIDKLRPPYNVSVINAEAGLFALENVGEYSRQAALICSERERLMAAVATLPHVQVFKSEANMFLVRFQGISSAEVFERLRARGILVKNVTSLHPLLAQCLRLTVGTADENNLLINALKASL
jgi:histidinol-phosphate aminotransferase